MSRYDFTPNFPVAMIPCDDYSEFTISRALKHLLDSIDGLGWVRPGVTVGIKANLVSAMRPEECATTHPALLCALTGMLRERGARVIIGDSPGGVYTSAFVNHVYSAAGMSACEAAGAELNRDLGTVEARFPEARVLKSFTYTSWLDSCDFIINVCKLKSHGMMGMSAAVKNMFGVIPGTMKPEYHFRFPNMADFAHMLVDINDYFSEKVRLCLVDAVDAMEGNGPTKGTPRHIGVLLASVSPHTVDAVCRRLICLSEDAVPTLSAARERDMLPDEISLSMADYTYDRRSVEDYAVQDFRHVAVRHGHLFASKGKLVSKVLGKLLSSRPELTQDECIGCGKCAEICPAKAIVMENRKAVIDRDTCIRCFCCQEFCPMGAMKVHRTWIARILVKSKR